MIEPSEFARLADEFARAIEAYRKNRTLDTRARMLEATRALRRIGVDVDVPSDIPDPTP